MYTIDKNLKTDTLITALVMREQEVFGYQINIDNYEKAISLAGDNPDKAEMVNRLEELLVTEKEQQGNAQLMLDAIEAQLKELKVDIAAQVKAVETNTSE